MLPAGKHQVRMEFTYDGGGLGRGGSVTLYLDGAIGEGRMAQPNRSALLHGRNDGRRLETGTTVAGLRARASKFNGRINWIQLGTRRR